MAIKHNGISLPIRNAYQDLTYVETYVNEKSSAPSPRKRKKNRLARLSRKRQRK